MKRKELLESGLMEEKNVTTIVATTLSKDAKMIKKAKRDLEDKIEELEEQLEDRLSSTITLDSSVIVVTYASLKQTKELLNLYNSFEKEYLS